MPLQFNTAYYLQQNPDVAAALDSGAIPSAQWHFENFGAAEGRDPNANFDVSYYLAQNPDVAEAFENGVINPFDHFLRFGASENRAPSANLAPVAAGFDEQAYLAANEDVAAAVQSGVFANGYQHWVVYGRYEDSRPEATFNGGTPVSNVADTIDATELTAALNALQTAQSTESDFLLQQAPENAGFAQFAQEATSPTIDLDSLVENSNASAIGNAVDRYYSSEAGNVGSAVSVTNFATRSTTLQDTAISEHRNDLQKAVTDATAQTANGMTSLLQRVNSAETSLEDALKAQFEANQAYTQEQTVFNSVNAGTTYSLVDGASNADEEGEYYFTDNQLVVVTTSADTSSDPATPAQTTVLANQSANGTWSLTADGNGLNRVNDLINKHEAAESAADASNTASTSLENAVVAVYKAETGASSITLGNDVITGDTVPADANDDVNVVVDFSESSTSTATDGSGNTTSTSVNASDVQDLSRAISGLDNFNELVKDFQNARELNSQRTDLSGNVTEARNAIEDNEADNGLGVALLEGNQDFAGGDEVYLYNENDSANQSLDGFGDAGQDRIFFGDGYNFVQIPDGSTTANNLGNVSELDIFWQQNGSDLNIFVENETFAGNSSSPADLTQITLTGVNPDEVNFANGYLSAGQMA